MKNQITNMLSDDKGNISHKRILGTLGFIAITFSMVYNSVAPKEFSPSPELIHAVEYITMSAIFGTVIEKFTNK